MPSTGDATETVDLPEFWVGPRTAPDTFGLVSMLGGGGEGEVWEAILPLSASGRRKVAVKIMTATGRPGELDRWEQSGHLLRSLAHPGLVRVTDVFAGAGMHRAKAAGAGTFLYAVMDYLEGVSLREWVVEHPDTPASERLRMLRMVAAALDAMHSGATTGVPVAHGDVKPANIVVRADRGTVLVDLGLARLTDDAGVAGLSAPYAAPELRTADALPTPEADRYAFAVTTAQVLTGSTPPLDVDGWLDEPALERQLRTSPIIAGRAVLVQQILTMIASGPADRASELRPWLDSAVESLSQLSTPLTARRALVDSADASKPAGPRSGAEPVTSLRAGSSALIRPTPPTFVDKIRAQRTLISVSCASALALALGAGALAFLPRTAAQASAEGPVASVAANASPLPSAPTPAIVSPPAAPPVPPLLAARPRDSPSSPARPDPVGVVPPASAPEHETSSPEASTEPTVQPAGRVLDVEIFDDGGTRAKVISWGAPKDDQLGGGRIVGYQLSGVSDKGSFSVRVTTTDYLDRRNYCAQATYTFRVVTAPPGGGDEVVGTPYVSPAAADASCAPTPTTTPP